jgi:tRNA(fMet)-specific endonuclease VapC
LIYLLDTNICIYALNRRLPQVLERLRSISRSALAVSVITVLELRQGAEKSVDPQPAHQKLDFFLSPIRALPFEEDAALVAARIRAHLERVGKRIGDLDSLIAAQAIALDLILVTNNLREFERVPNLRAENWAS